MDINQFVASDTVPPHYILMIGLDFTQAGKIAVPTLVYSGLLREVPEAAMDVARMSIVHPGTLAAIKSGADALLDVVVADAAAKVLDTLGGLGVGEHREFSGGPAGGIIEPAKGTVVGERPGETIVPIGFRPRDEACVHVLGSNGLCQLCGVSLY